MENTARKLFHNEQAIQSIKEGLDVTTLNNFLITTPEKALAYIEYWERKMMKATEEQKAVFALNIAKAEAIMERMIDLSLDVYAVNAEAYVDSRGPITPDTTVEDVITDVAAKADPVIAPVVDETPVISIFNGEKEVEKPTLKELSEAVKSLIKKGHFDSAGLLAGKYLTVGNYIPKKEKQTPEKWSEERIASWIRDINNNLMEEKVNTQKETEKKESTKQEEKVADAAAKGLTLGEVEDLRLLELVIPDAIAGHQDYQSRRDKLKRYFSLGNTLNDEEEMLWAVAKRIGAANKGAKLPEADLARLYVDIDAFCKKFFEHRPYTSESIRAWRDAAKTETGLPNFKFLVVKDNKTLPNHNMTRSGINMEALDKRIADEVAAGKTVSEVLAGLEEGILFKSIESKDKTAYNVYSKLHAKDLIERMYSVHATKPKVESKQAAETIISNDKSKVSLSEIKLLLATLAKNGSIFDDVKQHPEILNLIDREIEDNPKSQPLKFGTESVLFPYIENHFNEIVSKLPKVEELTSLIPEHEGEKEYAPLTTLLTLCEFAAKEGVSPEDFVSQQRDLIVGKDGKCKSLKSENEAGGSKVINIASEKDFVTWVNSVYSTVKQQTPTKETKEPELELVDSLKELTTKGKELIKTGTTYDKLITWLTNNLLNRKMKEQKPDKTFKTTEAIASFAKSTFGKELPVKETKQVTTLSAEDVAKEIAEDSVKDGVIFYSLIRKTKDLYNQNGILVNDHPCALRDAYAIVERIIEKSNLPMYADHMERKAKEEAAKQTKKATETAEPLQGPVEATTETIVEPVATVEPENTIDVESHVFEKVDLATADPELWKTIEKFTTIEQVYNMAVEYREAGKLDEALSVCLTMLPKVEDSKEWDAEYITDWFKKIVLNKDIVTTIEDSPTAETPAENKADVVEYKDLQNSSSPKAMRRAIQAILKDKEDSKELRKTIIDNIKQGGGSHARKVGKMPEAQIHEMINKIKNNVSKFAEAEVE